MGKRYRPLHPAWKIRGGGHAGGVTAGRQRRYAVSRMDRKRGRTAGGCHAAPYDAVYHSLRNAFDALLAFAYAWQGRIMSKRAALEKAARFCIMGMYPKNPVRLSARCRHPAPLEGHPNEAASCRGILRRENGHPAEVRLPDPPACG